jgi:chromosome segregation ATPase
VSARHVSQIHQSNLEDAKASFASYDMEENKARMKELTDTISDLKTQIQTMEVRMKQEEHMKRRVMEDCQELVKNNTTMKCELEEVQRRLKKASMALLIFTN